MKKAMLFLAMGAGIFFASCDNSSNTTTTTSTDTTTTSTTTVAPVTDNATPPPATDSAGDSGTKGTGSAGVTADTTHPAGQK